MGLDRQHNSLLKQSQPNMFNTRVVFPEKRDSSSKFFFSDSALVIFIDITLYVFGLI